MNGLVALGLGFVLLAVVAWVDRRYLQRYEEVRSIDEERGRTKPRAGKARAAGPAPSVEPEELPTEQTPAVDAGARRRPAKAKARSGNVQIKAQPVAATALAEDRTPSGRVATLDRDAISWKDGASDDDPSDDDPSDRVWPRPTLPEARRAAKASRPAAGQDLPRGAEAALASILEAIPDPRNTIALTKDPTAEVRLTPVERRAG